jgi:hypothetical protein
LKLPFLLRDFFLYISIPSIQGRTTESETVVFPGQSRLLFVEEGADCPQVSRLDNQQYNILKPHEPLPKKKKKKKRYTTFPPPPACLLDFSDLSTAVEPFTIPFPQKVAVKLLPASKNPQSPRKHLPGLSSPGQ